MMKMKYSIAFFVVAAVGREKSSLMDKRSKTTKEVDGGGGDGDSRGCLFINHEDGC